jgi:hypothetical protein
MSTPSALSVPRSSVTPTEAAQRALAAVGTGVYIDGTGTWPPNGDSLDCVGLAWSLAYKMPRHIPGLNSKGGGLGDVENDANSNSLIGDALTEQRYVEIVTTPGVGHLLLYPTIHDPRNPLPITGHAGIITGISRAIGKWDPANPDYTLLDTVQSVGPDGRKPGVIAMDGRYFAEHAKDWPNPLQTTRMVRVLTATA